MTTQDYIDTLRADFPVLLENVYCGISYGPGWDALIRGLCAELTAKYPEVRCAQIKEKFGGLRFYVGPSCKEADALISAAEAESFKICEQCGAPGKPRGGGWIKTLCDLHAGK